MEKSLKNKLRKQREWILRKPNVIKSLKVSKGNNLLAKNIRKQVRDYIFQSKSPKKMKEITGASPEKYKDYLESKFTLNMNWNNYGDVWCLDHIIPCRKFNLENKGDILECFNYKNTQPIYCIVNSIKASNPNYEIDLDKILQEFDDLEFSKEQLNFIAKHLPILYFLKKFRDELKVL